MNRVEFDAERKTKFDRLVVKYEIKASALLPTLYLAQEQFGYLTPPILEYVAKILSIPPAQAFEAASFYFLYKKKDMGKFCLQICNNVTCSMMGAEKLFEVCKQELGIGVNELTADKTFSLLSVQCLGSCDTAPVVQVNEAYEENQTPEKFKELLRRLGKEGRAS